MDQEHMEDCVDLVYNVIDGTDEDMLVASLPPVVIVHGLLDHKENWTEIARTIADKSVRKVYVLDIRNHGESPRSDSMTVEGNVRDLDKMLQMIGEPVVLIGHSLGGIIAMEVAFKKLHSISELILIDISPLRYPEYEEEFGGVIATLLRKLTNSPEVFYKKKSMLECQLKKLIKDESYCKVILSNLIEENDQLKWKANINVLEAFFCQKKTVRSVFPMRGSYRGRTLLIHGNSDYVWPSNYKNLEKNLPNLKIIRLKEFSHWIHIANPDELVEIILPFLQNS